MKKLAVMKKSMGLPEGSTRWNKANDRFAVKAVQAFMLKAEGYSNLQIARGMDISEPQVSNLLTSVRRSWAIVKAMKEVGFKF